LSGLAGPVPEGAGPDERVRTVSLVTRLMRRPELGAVAGLGLVTLFFLAFAREQMFTMAGILNFLSPAAQLGILAVGAAMLMIGGEFDLSVGSMVAFAGLVFGGCVVGLEMPFLPALAVTFAVAAACGAVNGQIVLRTRLPSFVVTLAFLFILRGLTLVGLKWATGGSTQLRGVREALADGLGTGPFSGFAFSDAFAWLAEAGLLARFDNGRPSVEGVPVEILWFAGRAAVATWLLLRTRFGNWIFAAGGDADAARNSGVPVDRVKTVLFVASACCAALVAILTVVDTGSTDARRGFQKEFEAIIAAVIGGCLLTGGYGSAVGAFIGSVLFGMVAIGLAYTDIDQDWYLVFLGVMLLLAVIFNNAVRRRVTGER
jgi:simple sugar transport system permease protein